MRPPEKDIRVCEKGAKRMKDTEASVAPPPHAASPPAPQLFSVIELRPPHTYTHRHTHTYIYIFIHTNTHTHTHTHTHIYTHTHNKNMGGDIRKFNMVLLLNLANWRLKREPCKMHTFHRNPQNNAS